MTTHDDDRPELDTSVSHTEPCPKCLSPDNVKVYRDGHAKCYSGGCDYWRPPTDSVGNVTKLERKPREPDVIASVQIKPLSIGAYLRNDSRKLAADTFKKFGIYKGEFHGEECLVHPIYDQRGDLAYQKIRLPGKQFKFIPVQEAPPKPWQCQLQGMSVYGEKYDKSCTIVVGEMDMLTLAQVIPQGGAFFSVVAGDDMAVKNIQANYLALDRFQTIRLWFDNDESGQKIIEPVAQLFSVGKVKLCKVPEFKDPSEVLMQGDSNQIVEAYWAAPTWRPRGLVNAKECKQDVIGDDIGLRGYDFPWPKLNEMTMGLLPGHVMYIVAGTGIGKTTLLYELEHSLLKQGAKIGIMGLEDMRRDVQLGLMTVEANIRLQTTHEDKGLMDELHDKVFGDERVILFDPDTAEWSMDAILGYVRFMAKAHGCNGVVVDPLSFVAAAMAVATNNPVAQLDNASMQFAALAKELGIFIIIAHHLKRVEGQSHEEGGKVSLAHLRGSGGVAMFASYVLALERNQQPDEDDDTEQAGETQLRLLKNRPGPRKPGLADRLDYNETTGRLLPIPEEQEKAGPGARVAAQRAAQEEKEF